MRAGLVWILVSVVVPAWCTPSTTTAGAAGLPTSYTAAAVQFTAVGRLTDTAAANNRASFNAFDGITAEAARAGAQVIVFPEAVLWHWGLHHPGPSPQAARSAIFNGYAEPLPEIGSNPCSAPGNEGNGIARRLSCMARRHRIILVANPIDIINCTSASPSCPSDNHFLYNTAVAFDEQGDLVAIYHKRHNGGTYPVLDQPKGAAQVSSFVSSFGVRFGLFICYDMDFSEPAADLYALGVRDFLFPTFWDNEPPFQTAAATQQGWSRAWGVNLVAANSGDSNASAGGGLFSSGEVVKALFNPSQKNIQETVIGSLTTNRSHNNLEHTPHHAPKHGRAVDGHKWLATGTTNKAEGTFPCRVASIDKNVNNQSLASGQCARVTDSASIMVQSGRTTCHLTASLASQPEGLDSDARYILWASDGVLTYIGCPDAERLQTCAVLACARSSTIHGGEFVCSSPLEASIPQIPHMENFVLHANFTVGTEVLPVVNLLDLKTSASNSPESDPASNALLLPVSRVHFSSADNGNAVLSSTGLKIGSERVAGAVLYGLHDP